MKTRELASGSTRVFIELLFNVFCQHYLYRTVFAAMLLGAIIIRSRYSSRTIALSGRLATHGEPAYIRPIYDRTIK
jgi:hypothetical protein